MLFGMFLLILFVLFGIYYNYSNDKVKNADTDDGLLYEEDAGDVSFNINDQIDDAVSDSSGQSFDGYKRADEEARKNFEIKNVKLEKNEKNSILTGAIVNNGEKASIILKVDFYEGVNVKGSSSIPVSLNRGEIFEFEIKTLNDIISDNYKVYVEYISV